MEESDPPQDPTDREAFYARMRDVNGRIQQLESFEFDRGVAERIREGSYDLTSLLAIMTNAEGPGFFGRLAVDAAAAGIVALWREGPQSGVTDRHLSLVWRYTSDGGLRDTASVLMGTRL